eukprot:CAMPEP_0176447868 /NCGR_PEP_ID=MMETSP0127-20121128/25343_1 /TAXON_ID=938130 /ORGANISM="Platyophrya macrostoma, Strain WH" /LENGTH=148 /DNA_ID=CAMNT_0017834507 /DNA_START=50 /DNA_END=496 /DNA_ORIENTATION=-
MTRSKSDVYCFKPTVLSPVPVKRQSLDFLGGMAVWDNCDQNDDALNSQTAFPVRKFNSVGVLNLEERWLERLDQSPDQRVSERKMFEAEASSSYFESSSYTLAEIPTRASNPLINDLKFRESENQKNMLESVGNIESFAINAVAETVL